jgi:hypothetical protein
LRISKAAICFQTKPEVLAAEIANLRPGRQRQRSVYTDRVSEFPRSMNDILFGNKVLREIPSPPVATEYQLAFDLSLHFLPGGVVWLQKIGPPSWPTISKSALSAPLMFSNSRYSIGLIQCSLLVNRKTILPTKTRKNGALIHGGLSIEVELCRPPAEQPVFKFSR